MPATYSSCLGTRPHHTPVRRWALRGDVRKGRVQRDGIAWAQSLCIGAGLSHKGSLTSSWCRGLACFCITPTRPATSAKRSCFVAARTGRARSALGRGRTLAFLVSLLGPGTSAVGQKRTPLATCWLKEKAESRFAPAAAGQSPAYGWSNIGFKTFSALAGSAHSAAGPGSALAPVPAHDPVAATPGSGWRPRTAAPAQPPTPPASAYAPDLPPGLATHRARNAPRTGYCQRRVSRSLH
ncbi:hypothetical protein NB706_000109 [Xanthomonas sacchari]|nr:hypothetical protein [Xanthomonas sacchari]